VTREATVELMRRVDLVVATGSQTSVRAAYQSGTPAIGVGAGNVVVIVDETADVADAARKIAESKMFDHATSCSSENSVIAVNTAYDALLAALQAVGGARLDASERTQLERAMFEDGKLSPQFIAQSAPEVARRAGLDRPDLRRAGFLLVEETGVGKEHPFSGEIQAGHLSNFHFRGPRAVRRRYALDHASVVSSIRLEKPHSLSYQAQTLTRVPWMTLVSVAS